ncbi:MAG TPA: aldo/keto reductase [Armatimonadota bacterium]|nr:aldo/keto reductase [Armatimonadota bacterium]HOS43174.1 aldo/keto reductase [Armatimonadota bacterium]
MHTTRLGKTGLTVTRTAFGVLPLQRTDAAEATHILRRAYDAGITFYDTARAYTDSEEKIGRALGDVRDRIVIATKSGATTKAGVLADLETSLRGLRTDYVDILQLHNPGPLPDPDDPDSAYAGLLDARAQGKIRFPGISNHSLERARAAVASGLYATLQFPVSHLSTDDDLAIIAHCAAHDVGLIAMKPLCGGLLTHARTAFAFLRQYDTVVPIWGIQHMHELEELLALDANPPALDAAALAAIARDRDDLAGAFCRACGYCLPCPAGIPIPMAARMKLLLRRMPFAQFLTDDWRANMGRIRACVDCGHCRDHCPYGLDTPALLRAMLDDYEAFSAERV